MHLSDDSKYAAKHRKTSEFNKYFRENGVREVIKSYKPAWFNFNPHFGQILGLYIPHVFDEHNSERVILESEEGKFRIDIVPKK